MKNYKPQSKLTLEELTKDVIKPFLEDRVKRALRKKNHKNINTCWSLDVVGELLDNLIGI